MMLDERTAGGDDSRTPPEPADRMASHRARPKPADSGRVVCRPIQASDLAGVADVLCRGFRRRTRDYWTNGLARLARLAPPEGLPQFGHLLEASNRPVGVHLLISSRAPDNPAAIRCNVSSWYVDPEFRLYGALLTLRATGRRAVTYVNISPDASTLPIIEAQGFTGVRGAYAAVPLLATRRGPPARIASSAADRSACSIPPEDLRLLSDHEAFGCLSLWCATRSGGQPLIFRRRRVEPGLPCAQLIYCRSLEQLEEVAQPVGRFLAMRGMPALLVAAPQPLRGVPGKFFGAKFPIYSRGPCALRPGDLSYTEAALFGM